MSVAVIWVSDLHKSIAYYEALFEVSGTQAGDNFAAVASEVNEVLLHLLPEEYRAEPSYGEMNPIKPVFEVVNIEDARTAAAAYGGMLRDESNTHGEWTYVDGTDPDGHVIQVRQRG